MNRALRWVGWSALAVVGVLMLLVAAVLWMLNTQSGTRWAVGMASKATDQQLAVQSVEGTIAGPLSLRGLHYKDPVSGLEVTARAIDIDVALRALLHSTVQIDSVTLDGIDVALSEQPPEDDDTPFSLEAPIDIVLQRLAASNINVRKAGETLVSVTRADAAASWTGAAGIAVSQLDVLSPQGEVHFKGRVQQHDTFVGDGDGRFRWHAGDLDYAGTLHAEADTNPGKFTVRLSSPLQATVDATLTQAPTLSWTMDLRVPEFDPRQSLLPDSSFQSLAATLKGTGTVKSADLAGQVSIDGQTLILESLKVAANEHDIDLDTLLKLGNGSLKAKGKVLTDTDPVSAKLALDWGDIDIPEQWAGQVLHTRGHIDFDGSAASYGAKGKLSLGPDKRVANIELDVRGTDTAVKLTRLDVVQPKGRLASTGELTLKPQLGWTIDATARGFDPGAFASAWSGNLDFTLNSAGHMTDKGPDATLKLDKLRGRLRNRALNGTADLSLRPGMLLAGNLDVRSGGSQVLVDASRSDTALNAKITAHITTLADWIPDASGAVQARIVATGQWPAIDVDAQAEGSSLHLADLSADSLSATVKMSNPQQPSGSVQLDVSNVAAAGFRFDKFHATLDGAAADHRLTLRADGNPLAAQLAVQGSLQGDAWDGSIQQLVLDLTKAAKLTLQSPAQVHYAKNAVSVSQSCFADRDIHLCVAGKLDPDGGMQATYSLQHVPLALANALAPGTVPVDLDGIIEGDGEVQRSAQGTLSGHARLSSPAGKVSQAANAATVAPVTLLSYRDLLVSANLNGASANLETSAVLDQSGSLQGEAALDGLGTASTSLRGSVRAMLPSIAVVEAFAPQVANVHGSLQLQANIAGTLDQPQVSGSLAIEQLAADLLELGLKLKDGHLSAQPRSDGQFSLEGSIVSGDGKLNLDGTATADGNAQINIRGNRFLAADIPGARVLITPDLNFARTPQQMSLTGKVTLPEATINLQKLPRGTSVQRASSDVVVIEAQTPEAVAAQATPLVAEITVILGDKVNLTGFGLEATLNGQLIVRERPGAPTSGSGEVRVAGTYKAYGQDLTVQTGQLLFAGTPIDNPRLNIVAVRTVGDVNAGLRITGNAQNPQLAVFSDPPMGQANALAYVVTGKPLDQVGSSSGDSDALQSAARSMGSAAGGLLAKKIGGRLGIDEVGVKDSDAIGGSAFTVGQYLSPRLYLSYGIGLFQPGEVMTLRYKLKEGLAIQAERGPKDTRAGVEYRIEK
jgi:translocation and assembly module TamB